MNERRRRIIVSGGGEKQGCGKGASRGVCISRCSHAASLVWPVRGGAPLFLPLPEIRNSSPASAVDMLPHLCSQNHLEAIEKLLSDYWIGDVAERDREALVVALRTARVVAHELNTVPVRGRQRFAPLHAVLVCTELKQREALEAATALCCTWGEVEAAQAPTASSSGLAQ